MSARNAPKGPGNLYVGVPMRFQEPTGRRSLRRELQVCSMLYGAVASTFHPLLPDFPRFKVRKARLEMGSARPAPAQDNVSLQR